jgi:DNA-binding CsgD family transcriptional regulator
VLVLSGYPERQYALNVLRAGASGYVAKDCAPEEILKAARTVLQGRRYVSESLAELLLLDMDGADKPLHSLLSEREFQIFGKLAAGQGVADIGRELCLSVKTVSTYRTRILEKMRMKNNADPDQLCVAQRDHPVARPHHDHGRPHHSARALVEDSPIICKLVTRIINDVAGPQRGRQRRHRSRCDRSGPSRQRRCGDLHLQLRTGTGSGLRALRSMTKKPAVGRVHELPAQHLPGVGARPGATHFQTSHATTTDCRVFTEMAAARAPIEAAPLQARHRPDHVGPRDLDPDPGPASGTETISSSPPSTRNAMAHAGDAM